MRWYARFIYLFLLVLACKLLWSFRQGYVFENTLDSLFITFDDFAPSYSQALLDASAKHEEVKYDFPALEKLDPDVNQTTIPPIIHFIWFKDLYQTHAEITTIPSDGSDAPDWCRTYNPEYEIKTWSATEARTLLEEHYAWFLPTYDNYRHPIQRVDAVKYFVLWHYGGFYLDLDVSCRRALDPLLNFPAWFPRASPLGVNNDVMASRAGHPLVWKMIETLKPRDKNLFFPYLTIFWTTGPKFTSDLLQVWLHERSAAGWEKKNSGMLIATVAYI